MKARWLIITVLLAFPFAFAFFLREARLGEKHAVRPALVVSPPTPASVTSQSPSAVETRAETSTPAAARAEPSHQIENRESKIQNSPAPALLSGTFITEDATLIYDAEAKLRLAKDVILSSPTGVMVSNESQTLFAGDMQIESGKNIITAHEGVLDTTTSQMKATVASISFTNENNQLVRMTGENVTLELPAGDKNAAPKEMVAESLRIEATNGTFSGTTAPSTPKP